MRTHPAGIALAFLLIFCVALPAGAYVYPLSTTAIREAYMTAQHSNQASADFLAPYTHTFPIPETGPQIASIGLVTPFMQVVAGSGGINYHSVDAERDFLGKPLDVIVRVQINFTPTFPKASDYDGPSAFPWHVPIVDDVWHTFKITLSQDKEIESKSRHDFLMYNYESPYLDGLSGFIMEQHYNPADVDSDWVTIGVDSPDGQHIETRFDLLRLR
jgi:hypothetical protein